MFGREIIESLFFIAVITAAIIGYGVAVSRKDDRDAASRPLDHGRGAKEAGGHKQIA
jgi:hypothetical protein